MTPAAGGDARITVTFFRDAFASKKEEQQVALNTLAALIEQQSALTKAALPWVKFAKFGNLPTEKNSLRWDGNVLEITGIEADYDGGRISFDEAVEIAEKAGLAAIVYTSPSHSPDKPRWRVLCPTSIKLPPTQRSHLLDRLNGLYGGIFAAESWTLSQSYYFGSVDHNPAHRVEIVEGQEIDRHDELDLTAIGKPATKPGNGADHPSPGGHADEQALINQIVTGDSYHTAAIRLLGLWAHRGLGMLDAEKQLRGIFDGVFPPDHDQRWQARVNEIPRLLQHVWGKEARKPGASTPEEGNEIIREAIGPHAIAEIPPRPWAYGSFLLFGHASVIGAVDGGGKGTLAIAIALSMITGRALLNEHVWRTGPVAIVTYEDDKDEWDRRIAAACIHYKLDYTSVKTQLHFLIRKDRSRIRFAAQSQAGTIYPDSDGIIRALKEIGAVLLIVDPFNLAHDTEDGNSNVVIAKVAGEVSRIAAASGAPVLVLHHLRKGSTGSVDDLMGATALRANFRSCRILTKMTPAEGAKLKLPPDKQWWRHSRITGSKGNYAAPPEFTTWYRLVSVDLGNPAGIYVSGDNVHVTDLWTPPSDFAGVSLAAIKDIFDLIRQPPPGLPEEFYMPDSRSGSQWIANPIAKILGCDLDAADSIAKTWVKNLVLVKDEYHSAKRRKQTTRVTLNETKAAEILGPLNFQSENDQ